MNQKRPDLKKAGGAYPPKGVKRGKARPPLPVRRPKPQGGWPTAIKSERHGPDGSIARLRKEKKA